MDSTTSARRHEILSCDRQQAFDLGPFKLPCEVAAIIRAWLRTKVSHRCFYYGGPDLAAGCITGYGCLYSFHDLSAARLRREEAFGNDVFSVHALYDPQQWAGNVSHRRPRKPDLSCRGGQGFPEASLIDSITIAFDPLRM